MYKYTHYQLILVLLAIPIILGLLFPVPYFHVWYDSEPDYISNTLSMLTNNYPVDYIHPGITINYLSSIFIHIVGSFESLESLVKLLRVFLIYVNLLLIYLAMVVLNKSNQYHVYLYLIFLLILPSSFSYFDILNPNILLGSLGLLTAIMGAQLHERSTIFSIYFGVVLAIGFATKYHFILMSAPLLISIFFGMIGVADEKFKIIKFIALLSSFLITSFILLFPILPMIPFWITLWGGSAVGANYGFNDLTIWHIILYFFILILIISSVIVSLKKYYWKRSKYKYEDIYSQSCFLILFFLLLALIINIVNSNSYISLSYSQRNLLPFFCFVGLFLSSKYSFINKFKFKQYLIYILLLSVIIKAYSNFTNYEYSSNVDSNFSKAINENISENNLVFFPTSRFTSKDYFLLWADYRYGDRINSYAEQKKILPFKLSIDFDKLHILNFRSFYLKDNIQEKFSYKYFNYLLNNEYTPSIHKGIIKNHLDGITVKDICKKPYNDFTSGSIFTVIVPLDLRFHSYKVNSYADKDGNITSRENTHLYAKEISDDLTRAWSNECNYEVDYSLGKFADAEVIFLKIKT